MGDIVRIGKVSALNTSNRTVRVLFASEDIVSGWLKVIKSPPPIGCKDGTDNKTEEGQGHRHGLTVYPWFPAIGDTVLCIYNPGFNEDGYVIGAL